jgi:hypothetical protein
MKKNPEKYNLGLLPVMIEAFVEVFQTEYPLMVDNKDEVVQTTLAILQEEIGEDKEPIQVVNMDAFILQKMIAPLNVPKEAVTWYFDWGMEWWEKHIPVYIGNIIENHGSMIIEYVVAHPDAFSIRDKQLWHVFSVNRRVAPRQLASIMGMESSSAFNQACHGLLNSCFKIYEHKANSKFK